MNCKHDSGATKADVAASRGARIQTYSASVARITGMPSDGPFHDGLRERFQKAIDLVWPCSRLRLGAAIHRPARSRAADRQLRGPVGRKPGIQIDTRPAAVAGEPHQRTDQAKVLARADRVTPTPAGKRWGQRRGVGSRRSRADRIICPSRTIAGEKPHACLHAGQSGGSRRV
jgi:hypothetical protein